MVFSDWKMLERNARGCVRVRECVCRRVVWVCERAYCVCLRNNVRAWT